MIAIDASKLIEEVRDAEKKRDGYLCKINDIVKRTLGGHWTAGMRTEPTPENYAWSFVQFAIPQLVFDRPGVKCSNKSSVGDSVAWWMETALNHWCMERELKEHLDRLAFDIITGYGVTKICLAPASGGYQDGVTANANLPVMRYIRRGDFVMDAYCDTMRDARVLGHRFEMYIDELRQNPLYDLSEVGDVSPNEPDARKDVPWDEKRAPAERKPVVTLYELYLPEHRRVVTLLEKGTSGASIIRNTEYSGPDEGPYTIWGAMHVPASPYPISPLAGVWDEFVNLNDHATQANIEASTYKRMAIVNSSQGEIIKSAKSGDVLAVNDAGNVEMLEVGGVGTQRVEMIGFLRQRLDRAMGFTDAQRGKSSSSTATSEQIAEKNSDLRMEKLRQRMRDCCADMLRKVAWYMWYEDTVIMRVAPVDPVTGTKRPGIFIGGQQQGQEDMNFVDLAIDIDPRSMTKVDDAVEQKRAQDMFALVAQVAPLVLQFPHIRWRELLNTYGNAIGQPELADKVLDSEMVAMMSGVPLMPAPGMPENPLLSGRLGQQAVGRQVLPKLGMSPGVPTQGAMMAGAGNVG